MGTVGSRKPRLATNGDDGVTRYPSLGNTVLTMDPSTPLPPFTLAHYTVAIGGWLTAMAPTARHIPRAGLT